jgi:hypothetical protein
MTETLNKPAMLYRDRLAVWADKYLFMLLFIGGTIAIVAMKYAHFPQLAVTALPVAAMLLYGSYVLFSPRYRIRSDRAGDSLYYLGFLFTMVSLAYSLYEFRASETNTASIVTNFGIALATTILGLMLRVVYHQLREDPFDIEQETRVELADAASRLHGTLLKAESDFENLRLTVSQVVSEAAEDTKKRMKSIADEVETTTKIQTQFVSKFSDEAMQELRQHHSDILKASRNMSMAVSRIATRIDNVQIPTDTIKDRLESVAIPPDIIKDRLASVNIPPEIIHDQLKRVEIPSDIFTSRFDSITGQLQRIVNGFAERAASEAKALQLLEDLTRAAAGAAEQLRLAITGAGKDDEQRRMQLISSLQTFTSAVNSLQTTTEALAHLSKDHVDEYKKLIDGLATSSALALKAVENHRQQLEGALISSGHAVEQVQGSLVSLTRTVVEKLNGRA